MKRLLTISLLLMTVQTQARSLEDDLNPLAPNQQNAPKKTYSQQWNETCQGANPEPASTGNTACYKMSGANSKNTVESYVPYVTTSQNPVQQSYVFETQSLSDNTINPPEYLRPTVPSAAPAKNPDGDDATK